MVPFPSKRDPRPPAPLAWLRTELAALGISGPEVVPSARLADLGVKAIDLIDLGLAAQQAFGVDLPDDLASAKPGAVTVGHIIGAIEAAGRPRRKAA